MIKHLSLAYGTTLGCDPEIFVTRIAGKLKKRTAAVPSEAVLPVGDGPRVTRDGVQVELHVPGNTSCRHGLSGQIAQAMMHLEDLVEDTRKRLKDPSVGVSFKPLIKLTTRDIAKLSPEARELNCKPSKNAYGREPIYRDGNVYPIRTASGHLHLGNQLFTLERLDPNDAVKILDLLVGIPCVLVDQSPKQAIRRETYGRAGEYRLPKHGVEYRVPSNFWLQDYKLMSMVFGLAKMALCVCEGLRRKNEVNRWATDMLQEKADFAKVEQAINTNDVDLALRVFKEAIRPFGNTVGVHWGFNGPTSMDNFEYFVDTIREHGLKHWFHLGPKAILARWRSGDINIGWERFLAEVVQPKRQRAKFTGIILDPVKDTAVRRRSRAVTEAEGLHAAA